MSKYWIIKCDHCGTEILGYNQYVEVHTNDTILDVRESYHVCVDCWKELMEFMTCGISEPTLGA